MNIIIYAIAKNEKKFAERFMASCADADGVYVLDTGSTDGTPDALRGLGAEVAVAELIPWRFDRARNFALSLVPAEAISILAPAWGRRITSWLILSPRLFQFSPPRGGVLILELREAIERISILAPAWGRLHIRTKANRSLCIT